MERLRGGGTVSRLGRCVLSCLLLCLLVSPVAATGVLLDTPGVAGVALQPEPEGETANGSGDAERTEFVYTFEAGERDRVRVNTTVELPPTVSELEVTLPDTATYVDSGGFVSEDPDDPDDPDWEWSREEDNRSTVWIEYTVSANHTDGDTIEGVGVGRWALFNWEETDLDWRYASSEATPASVQRARVESSGVAGPGFVYLGPYRTRMHLADGRTVQLIVPEAAEMRADPETVLSTIAAADRKLRVGALDTRLNVFVAPSPIDARGRLSRAESGGEQDVLVSETTPIETADNAWLHEYVHSRQAYSLDEDMAWFDEASAEYYGASLAYRTGRVSYPAFYRYVNTTKDADIVLSDPNSWESTGTYFKGMRVLAALDAKIRHESNGTRSLDDVFRRMNDEEGAVSYTDFEGFVADAAGRSLEAWLETYVQSSALPDVPNDDRFRSGAESANAGGPDPDGGPVGNVGSETTPTDGRVLDSIRSAPLPGQLAFASALCVLVVTMWWYRTPS